MKKIGDKKKHVPTSWCKTQKPTKTKFEALACTKIMKKTCGIKNVKTGEKDKQKQKERQTEKKSSSALLFITFFSWIGFKVDGKVFYHTAVVGNIAHQVSQLVKTTTHVCTSPVKRNLTHRHIYTHAQTLKFN